MARPCLRLAQGVCSLNLSVVDFLICKKHSTDIKKFYEIKVYHIFYRERNKADARLGVHLYTIQSHLWSSKYISNLQPIACNYLDIFAYFVLIHKISWNFYSFNTMKAFNEMAGKKWSNYYPATLPLTFSKFGRMAWNIQVTNILHFAPSPNKTLCFMLI